MRSHGCSAGLVYSLRVRIVFVIVVLLVPFAWSALGESPHRPVFEDQVVFDNSKHTIFWYGRELRSPVRFAFHNNVLAANGIVEEHKTTNHDSVLALRYGHLPIIMRMHGRGLTYTAALAEYDLAVNRNLQAMGLAYRRTIVLGESAAQRAARAEADTAIVVLSEPIHVNMHRVNATVRAYGRMSRRTDDPILDPRVQAPPEDRAPAARRTIQRLRGWLDSEVPVLIFLDAHRLVAVTGPPALEGRTYLRAVASAGAVLDYAAARVDSTAIPRGVAREARRVAEVARKERGR